MIDLHCHLLPGVDDGSKDLEMSLAMARRFVADGVTHVACTPHINLGVWPNSGPSILKAIQSLQSSLDESGISLQLLSGADNHIVPDFVDGLRSGRLLPIAGSRYVLVEPPHHVAPPRLEEFFFGLVVAGYVPILTHPERLRWIESHYDAMRRLVEGGVWMQLTSGSLAGRFGTGPKRWAYRMLEDGLAHILATDAHDPERRPPILSEGWALARRCVGDEEAQRLVLGRPFAIVTDAVPGTVQMPVAVVESARGGYAYAGSSEVEDDSRKAAVLPDGSGSWISRGLRRVLKQ